MSRRLALLLVLLAISLPSCGERQAAVPSSGSSTTPPSAEDAKPTPVGKWMEIFSGRAANVNWHVLRANASKDGICQAAYRGSSDSDVGSLSGLGAGTLVYDGHLAACTVAPTIESKEKEWIKGTKYLALSEGPDSQGLLIGAIVKEATSVRFAGSGASFDAMLLGDSFAVVFPLNTEILEVEVKTPKRSVRCDLPDMAPGVTIIC